MLYLDIMTYIVLYLLIIVPSHHLFVKENRIETAWVQQKIIVPIYLSKA